MNKTFLFLLFFFAVSLNSFATKVFKWISIYEHTSADIEVFEYLDQSFVRLLDMSSYQQGQDSALNIGETYILKISYGNPYSPLVDSCFIAYDYIPVPYEEDGFWTYANNGQLIAPDNHMGICNIEKDDEGYDPEDYPDEDPEFYTFMGIKSSTHFFIDTLGLSSYFKIEILAYREVDE